MVGWYEECVKRSERKYTVPLIKVIFFPKEIIKIYWIAMVKDKRRN